MIEAQWKHCANIDYVYLHLLTTTCHKLDADEAPVIFYHEKTMNCF